MIKITNPKIKKVLQKLSKEEIDEIIGYEVEKKIEYERRLLKPEIKEKIIYIPKNEYIYRKNPVNKALIWAVIIFGLALIFFVVKNSFAATISDAYERIFNIENYYEGQGELLGDSIINPTSYLSRLRDVSISGATTGQVLTYNGSAIWEASSTAVGLSSVLASGNVFIGNGLNIAEASSTSNLTGLPYLSPAGNLLGTWDSLATTSFLSTYSDFLGTWDSYTTSTLPYLANTLTNWTGTWDGLATTSFLLVYSDFKGTWDGYATNTLPYLSSTGDFLGTWDSLATTSFALQVSLGNYLLKSASTSLPYVSNSLTASSYVIGNGAGVAEATTTINLLTKAFTVASSTYFFSAGSSTIPLGYQFYNDTWSSLACQFIGGASPTGHVKCGDGTNMMEVLNVTGVMASTTLATNNLLQNKDLAQCWIEVVTNSPDLLTCNISYRRN